MAQYSFSENVTLVNSLAPAIRTASTTVHGSSVDTEGFEGVSVVFQAGTITDGTHTPVLEESPDGTTWNSVATGDIVQGSQLAAINSSSGGNAFQILDYRGSKRYVRVSQATTGATSGALSLADFVLNHARHLGGTTI